MLNRNQSTDEWNNHVILQYYFSLTSGCTHSVAPCNDLWLCRDECFHRHSTECGAWGEKSQTSGQLQSTASTSCLYIKWLGLKEHTGTDNAIIINMKE